MEKKRLMRIGDKIVEVDRVENGVPVIKTQAGKIHHPDGRVDVVITVPCMSISAKRNQ